VAARYKAWFCGRSLAGIVGLDPPPIPGGHRCLFLVKPILPILNQISTDHALPFMSILTLFSRPGLRRVSILFPSKVTAKTSMHFLTQQACHTTRNKLSNKFSTFSVTKVIQFHSISLSKPTSLDNIYVACIYFEILECRI
jgi:hypothetical protein